MKKHLVVVLSMLFVLGFAAPSFAIHAAIPAETTDVVAPRGTEIRLGGEIRVRGWYQENITATTAPWGMARTGRPYDSPQMGWYDQRVRLFVNVRTAPNVTGRILLETAPINYVWGVTPPATVGFPVGIREAWIAYTGTGLLGVPSGIRLGSMPLVVGEGTAIDRRVAGEDAILLWVEPAKGTDINFVAAKLSDGATVRVQDDIDLYSLKLTHRLDKDNTIGANLSLATSSDMDGAASIPAYIVGGRTVLPAVPATAGAALYRLPAVGAAYADAKLNLWNLGLLARGRVSDIGYRATVDFQFGRITGIRAPALMTRQEFRGWGATVGANYRIDPVTLRANFVYGSGDDDDRNIAGNTRNTAFQTLVDTHIDPNLPTVVYNNRVHTAVGALGTGIANTTAYNLGITFSPIKDMTTHIDYYLLRASERLAATGFGSNKDIGSELTLRKTYTIARGLTYHINAGVLFAGDFYKTGLADRSNDPKNAVVFQHGIVFAF